MLGGGGAKGGYQVGVIRALQEAKLIIIDMIAGTSIGAVNGLILSLETSYRKYDMLNQRHFIKMGSRMKMDRRSI